MLTVWKVVATIAVCMSASACQGEPTTPEPARSVTDTSPMETVDSSTPEPGTDGGVLLEGTVVAYDYTLDLPSGEATSQVTVDVTGRGDCIDLPCALPVSDVAHDGVLSEDWGLEEGQLTSCVSTIEAGQSVLLQTAQRVPEQTFRGLQVGFSRTQNLAGGTFHYLLSWVEGCPYHGPCDSHPSQFAAHTFRVDHAAGTTVLCPGELTPGDTQSTCTLERGPTYSSFAIAADADWERRLLTTSTDGVDIVFYEVPGGGIADALDADMVVTFFDWITGVLGPYPYGGELRVAGAPTLWLGFEHPGNVVLYERLPEVFGGYADTTMHVLMHEVVHQWAGDRTTLADTADFVWKEAIAEYLSYRFELLHGAPGDAIATRALWSGLAARAVFHPRPTDVPLPSVESFYSDTYGPGPMVLFLQLEDLIGEAAVMAAIQSFLSTSTATSVEDLKEALEAESGEDLDPYFDAWVYGEGRPTWPRFTASHDADGDRVTVTLTQTEGARFPCTVEVDVVGPSKTVTAQVQFGLNPGSSTAEAVVELNQAVTGLVIDPRYRLVDGNNLATAPRRADPWRSPLEWVP